MAPEPETEYDEKGLLKEAGFWDGQATLLARVTRTVRSMDVGASGGRAFSDCVDLYWQCRHEVADYTEEGAKVMQKITGGLADAAREYGATEDEIKAAIKNVGGRGHTGN